MISIIIPAYNEEKYISPTLESIKSQNFKNYELIVVCNGCSDNTSKVSKKYTENIVILKEANVMKAKNKGASIAKYNKLIFLDADTKFRNKNALSKIMKNNKDISTCFFLPDKISLKYILFFIIKNISSLFGAGNGILICDKNNFDRVNGFNIHKYPLENRDLINKIRKNEKFGVVNTFVITSMRRHNQWGLYSLNYWGKKLLLRKKNNQYEPIR
ncbi:MAG: glycosyltransferase family A protein [Candidatus Nanoarchaeia archaeon]|jgi:glycosyltransferase involved in cell wall biosynthesis|nr:glycosyltransferase family A protein [Candidatus Nanoarchaeia archaeon]|tara:strand:- start:15046 stop:15690 length:645 start_codon:yes stop_codon:yes gene_type:complete